MRTKLAQFRSGTHQLASQSSVTGTGTAARTTFAWDAGFMGAGGAASTPVAVAIGIFLVVLGGVLALDVKRASTGMLKSHWGERPVPWPNPYRVVGWFFFCVGIADLAVQIYHSI